MTNYEIVLKARLAELQKIIDLDTERFRELGEEIQELKKRIEELNELLDEIHLDATFNLSEPPGYEVLALQHICTRIENFWDKSRGCADE